MSWKIRIPRKSFRRNGPRNIPDPKAKVQWPVGWTYTWIASADEKLAKNEQPNYHTSFPGYYAARAR